MSQIQGNCYKNYGEIEILEYQYTSSGTLYSIRTVKPGEPEYEVAFMEWALINTKMTHKEIKERIKNER